MHHLESAGLPRAHAPFARGIRAAAAVLIPLVAPVISMSGALTTGLNGTSPAVRFPPGYAVSLAATVAATTLAAVLAALIARRDALVAIPVSLEMPHRVCSRESQPDLPAPSRMPDCTMAGARFP